MEIDPALRYGRRRDAALNRLRGAVERGKERVHNSAMRLFIGIPLAAAVIDELTAISARLRSAGDGLRWAAPATWHITLQFLGETSQEQFGCVAGGLRELRSPAVPIRLEELGLFDRSGIFLVGVSLTPNLLLLHRGVIAATRRCGFVPEARPFQPHITLARSKGRDRRPDLGGLKAKIRQQPEFTLFSAHEFLLYESFLGPGGSRYEVRERFALGRDSMVMAESEEAGS